MQSITTHDPELIQWHSLIAGLPRWEDDSAEMTALAADVAERGIDQPLIACLTDGGGETPGYIYLLDGRHRHRAALLAEIGPVPVIIRPEAEAMGIVINSLVQRRHYSKSALAYVTWPMFAPRAKSVGGNGNNQRKKKEQLPNHSVIALADIAAQIGVSEDLIGWAKKAHEVFAARPDLRAQFEPSILSGDLGLNRFQAAVDGKLAYEKTGGKRTNPEPETLLFQGFDMLKTRFGRWEKIAEGERATIAAEWVRTVYDLPDDVQRKTYESLRAKFQ